MKIMKLIKMLRSGFCLLIALSVSLASFADSQLLDGLKLTDIQPGKNAVTFESQGYILAGLLYAPEDFDPAQTYPSVVITTPFGQVKEQTGSVYAAKLAEEGFIALTYDSRGFGESEGALRSYMYSPAIVEGITDAISFTRMQGFVDKDNVFGLGVCAGASNIVTTALTDKRMNAIATVSGMLNNEASFFGAMDRETAVATLKMANEAQQKYYETRVQENIDFFGLENPPAEGAPQRNVEGYDYYMTERAGAQTYENYTHMTPVFVHMDYPRYNATAMAPNLYTPYLGIIGSDAHSRALTEGFYEAASEPKELHIIEGASHVSLYDIDKDVDRAIAKIVNFFGEYKQ